MRVISGKPLYLTGFATAALLVASSGSAIAGCPWSHSETAQSTIAVTEDLQAGR